MKNQNEHNKIDLSSFYNKSVSDINSNVSISNNGNWLTNKETPPKLMKNIK